MDDMRGKHSADASLPRQAMLLAAGLGSRLRPLTDRVPKCMVPVAGQPILAHVVNRLRDQGITDLVINLHHMAEAVTDHFGDGSAFGVRITWSYEPELLGTAGSVLKVANHFPEPFFVWYADNISTCRLDAMWAYHRTCEAWVTVALFERDDPTSSGIVGLDGAGMVTRFLEKPEPEEVFSHLVNAGILILEPKAVDAIPDHRFSDFGTEVLPALVAAGHPVAGYQLGPDEGLWWADRPEDLEAMATAMSERTG